MAAKILFAPRQPEVILDIARSLTPAAFELVVADPGTPEFYQAAADAEYYWAWPRRWAGNSSRRGPTPGWASSLAPGTNAAAGKRRAKRGGPGPTNAGP